MNGEAILIRAATAADLTMVLRHRRCMFAAMGYGDAARLEAMESSSASLFAQGLRDGGYRGFLAEEGGRVVAGGGILFLAYPPHPDDPRPRRPFVVNMFTEPEYRRRGLARLLLKAMIEWCREQGCPSLFLHASDDGRRLYEDLGFQPTNEMRRRL